MLEKKIDALKNMSKEELVGEFEKIVLYNTQHCFSISAIHQRRVSWRKSFQQCS